jgi:hypothetical protein
MLKRDPNQPVDTSKGYEISDVRVSMFVWGIAITFILTFAAFVAMRLFAQALEFTPSVSSATQPTAAAFRYEQLPPPGPGLQVNLEQDLANLVEPQKFMLHHYGWISEQEGLVHIPIEAAIDRVVRDGLPLWEAPEGEEVSAPEPGEEPEAEQPAQPEEAVDAPIAQ